MRRSIVLFSLFSLFQSGLFPLQTIDEKKAASLQKREGADVELDGFLQHVNQEMASLRSQLDICYAQVDDLHDEEAPDEEFEALLRRVNQIKTEMLGLERQWRELAVEESKKEEEGYALWDQEDTTLAQLVMEYGSMDYLYIVPPEVSGMKINMHSSVPIPRESWGNVLEIILAHNGIGMKQLNTYTRQLYVFKQDPAAIQGIASHPEDLLWLPSHSRLFYVFSPPVEQVKSTFQFFERFADAKQTFVYQIGAKITIVSSKEEIEKLLSLYNTVWADPKGKISRVVTVTKMAVKEMEKILQSFFGEAIEKTRPPFGKIEQEGLTVFSLGQGNALVLMGQQEVVDRAEKIVKDTEDQLQDPAEMTVYLYTCHHSDPSDLAAVLEKVYTSLIMTSSDPAKENVYDATYSTQGVPFKTPDGYAQAPPLVVSPPPLKPGSAATLDIEAGSDHFIPDLKTGNLLMVVRRDALVKIKELLRKLDVPKKMVQIEVLLFEKRINNQNNFGLNLLKLGAKQGGRYDGPMLPPEDGLECPVGRGVLEFFFTGHSSKGFPAYEVAYSFLMAQEDIQLNAAPSVITVNQTPATIAIVEEISINNGAAPVDTNKGIAFEKSFTRSQYGITIILTPTIHMPDREDDVGDGKGFVTLQTNITFDTTKPSFDDRPLVDRRHIENEVRVVDGQTVILGGLRRKSLQDKEEKIPFLGEIPGIGKLFGSTHFTDHNTEMFFFITPKIVLDPKDELDEIRTEELKKRAGDIPEFLEKVNEARERERKKYFRNSMKIFFGNNYD